MTIAEILRGAAELLSKPGAWTQGAWARQADGGKVLPKDSDAVCWCARGALWHVGGPLHGVAEAALEELLPAPAQKGRHRIAMWNDASERTAEEVCARLIEAAESLEKRVV
jgi:hypothetical protein